MLEARGAVASITSSKIGQERVFNGWNTFIQLRCGLESITNDRKCVVFVGKLWTSENNRRKSLERKMAALEQCYFYRHLSMFVDVCVAQWWAERGIWVHGWDGIYQQQMHEHAQPISTPPPHPFSQLNIRIQAFSPNNTFLRTSNGTDQFNHQKVWVACLPL